MAYDGASSWWGFLGRKINLAYLAVTTKAGDGNAGGAQDTGNTATGLAYARLVALTDGVADAGVLGSQLNPLHITGASSGAPYSAVDKGYVQQAMATTVAAGLSGVAAAITAGAKYAVIEPEGQNVRWRADGTNPSATVGNPLLIGQQLTYAATDLANLAFCAMVTGATLNINYYA